MTADPACKDGNAPKTNGELVKLVVYRSMLKSWSILANPAGDPFMS